MWQKSVEGRNVDAIEKAGQYAETQLPNTITLKVQKWPHMFARQLLQTQMKEKMILQVLNELHGNGSNAVTIHMFKMPMKWLQFLFERRCWIIAAQRQPWKWTCELSESKTLFMMAQVQTGSLF